MFEKLKEKRRAENEHKAQQLADMREIKRIELIKETRELCRIANLNVIEIKSSIINFNARINYATGKSPGETRKIRKSLTILIDKYNDRLREELFWVEHYESKLKELS